MLHSRLLQLGAQLFCQRGEGNEQHPEGHIGEFRSWIGDLKESLVQHFPLPSDQTIIPDDVFLEPKWVLRPVESERQNGSSCLQQEIKVNDERSIPGEDLLPIKGTVTADLSAITRVTPTDHNQDVRLMNLDIPQDISYGPGAVAVIYPKNFPKDVDEFIEHLDWQHVADSPIELVTTHEAADVGAYPPSPLRFVDSSKSVYTLRELLTNYLDILSIPRRTFFASLAYFAKESNEDEQYQKERLLELANPELIDELWDYTTRPKRTILEVMPDFPSIRIPWQYALSIIPSMRGRQFSIASGGTLKHIENWGTRVQLLVAIANPPNPIIKYRKRHGVCTRYIATLRPGQQLNIAIQQGYLNIKKEEATHPVLMIGPGTGVAPMRSLIHERRAWAKEMNVQSTPGCGAETVLCFGCRNEHADYFFKDEWEQLSHEGLAVLVGFSRDKDKPKNYVQDLIRASPDLVFGILNHPKGKVYVCGSSGNMPKGVREALVDVIREKIDDQDKDAESYLDRMEKEGRYKQETW
ncbi:hypothetical protein MBLNU459_g7459t1 [Dothideomycetes sp. NU459]